MSTDGEKKTDAIHHVTHNKSQKEYTQDSQCRVKLISVQCNGVTCMWMGESSACAGICHDLAYFNEVLSVFMLSKCVAQASRDGLTGLFM